MTCGVIVVGLVACITLRIDSIRVVKEDQQTVFARAVEYIMEKHSEALSELKSESKQLVNNTMAGKSAPDSGEKCSTSCIITNVVYATMLLLKMANFNCPLLSALIWMTLGLLVMTNDQKISFSHALGMLGQQVTSVGYGSHMPKDLGLRIFHALSGYVSQAMAKNAVFAPYTTVSDSVALFFKKERQYNTSRKLKLTLFPKRTYRGFAVVIPILVSTLYWLEYFRRNAPEEYSYREAFMEALYFTVITATSVGYGDIYPGESPGQMALTFPWSVFMTDMLEKANIDEDDINEDDHDAVKRSWLTAVEGCDLPPEPQEGFRGNVRVHR